MKKQRLYRDFFFHFDVAVMFLFAFVLLFFISYTRWSLSLAVTWLGGLVLFMFSEYITHRFLFHLKAPKNPFLLNLLKRLHYDHHRIPDDLKLLFLPLWYSIPNFLVLCGIFYLFVPSIPHVASFGLGLITMFLIYEWKHYIAHRPIKPMTKFGRWIKKTHTLHHYKNENYWYGVSNPFGDMLFGTLKDEKDVPMSQTAKDLESR